MKFILVLLILGCISFAMAKKFKEEIKVRKEKYDKIKIKIQKKEKPDEEEKKIFVKLNLSADVKGRIESGQATDADIVAITAALAAQTAKNEGSYKIAEYADEYTSCAESLKAGDNYNNPECIKIKAKSRPLMIKILIKLGFSARDAEIIYKVSSGVKVNVSADVVARIGKVIANIDLDGIIDAIDLDLGSILGAAATGVVDGLKTLGVGDITRQLADQVGQILGLLVDLIVQLVCQILGVAPQPVNQALNLGTQILGTGASAVTSLVSSLVPVVLQLAQQALDILDKVLGQALGALGGIGGGGSPKSPKSPKSPYPTPAPPPPKPY